MLSSCTLALDPPGMGQGLALGAMPVAEGGVLDGRCGVFTALGGEVHQCGCATVHHRPGDSELLRQRVSPTVVVEPGAQNMGHPQCRPQCRH